MKNKRKMEQFEYNEISYSEENKQYTLGDLITINDFDLEFDFQANKYLMQGTINNTSKYDLSDIKIKITFLNIDGNKIGDRYIEIDEIKKNSSKKLKDEFEFDLDNLIYDYKFLSVEGCRR